MNAPAPTLSVVWENLRQIIDPELGCNIAQGYLIGRPVPGSELQAVVNRWRRPTH